MCFYKSDERLLNKNGNLSSPDWRENPPGFLPGDLEGKRENGKQKCQMFRSKKPLSQNIY